LEDATMTMNQIATLAVGTKFLYQGWDAQKMSPTRIKVKYIGKPPVYIAIKENT
jgi:hypothetical protein